MDKRIKILFTIPNFDTAGSGKVVYDLVKGLDKQKFEPEICCFHNRGDYFENIKKLDVKIHIFNFAAPYRPFLTLPFRILKIGMFFKKHQFDIIHSWHWSSDFTEPLAARLAGIPFVYTKKAMGWGNKSWLWRSKLSKRIIAINTDMSSLFFQKLKYKVEYIPLGVDTEFYKPQKKSIKLQNELGVQPSDFVVITVANLVPVKGVEVLIEAVKNLKDDSIKLLIVGDYNNNYGKDLKNRYESNWVQFIGKQNDVRPYIALSDVFVIPTKNEGRKEGQPIAPLEAMAMGKVVVGSNVSGIKDILHEFGGNLIEPGNIKSLSLKIKDKKIFGDLERNREGLEMRGYVISKFALNKSMFSHEVLYKTTVK
ncbi:glycosyltransferase family 4 protein [Seonamhaeicola maritimus]|uniref:Glycosyltransferase family 4 protein n=1 Tax=Seonamhaeicola maritimus TaxID=2591822 RepID=A0A5C7GKQ7_9FLAO|nr:glycosyltransferase family 4 protein [Seonamhaeicola maritimus]TXG38874.1 glycosyltransferase family 4 protein [Seonamhaeicola maritimus]